MSVLHHGKIRVVVIEIVGDFCAEVHSTAPCTASRDDENECHNTFPTCQDTPNYNLTSKSYYFTMRNGPNLRDLSVHKHLLDWDMAPGKIDPRRGRGGRDKVTFEFEDFIHLDQGVDPYRGNRAFVGGYFWRKWKIRNRNYQGRTLKVHYGWMNPDSRTIRLADLSTVRFQLETIRIDGTQVKVIAKDILKEGDRRTSPPASDAKLATNLAAGAAVGTLTDGHDLSNGTVWLRINDEIMTGTLTGNALTVLSRGEAGTTDANHETNDKVQLCRVWVDERVDVVWEDLLENDMGIASALVDDTGAAAIVDDWLASIEITAYLSQPKKSDPVCSDLLRCTDSYDYWDPVNELVKFGHTNPRTPTDTAVAITSDANTKLGGNKVTDLEDQRITRVIIDYGVSNWSKDIFKRFGEDGSAYTRRVVAIDATAESANEYDDRRDYYIAGYFLKDQETAFVRALAWRLLNRWRNTNQLARVKLSARDAEGSSIELDTYVDATLNEVTDKHGVPVLKDGQVVSKRYPGGKDDGAYIYELHLESYGGRWDFYNTNDDIIYANATEAARRYGYYAVNATEKMPNGDPPYLYP